jgi:hypothetical protein
VVTLMFMYLPPDYSWRVMIACPLPQGLLLLLALLRIPETPRFLMNQVRGAVDRGGFRRFGSEGARGNVT